VVTEGWRGGWIFKLPNLLHALKGTTTTTTTTTTIIWVSVSSCRRANQ